MAVLFSLHCALQYRFAKQKDLGIWPNHLSFRFPYHGREFVIFSDRWFDLSANNRIGDMVLV